MNEATPTGGSRASDDYVDETMAKFRATLARMDANPAEAARIRALADKTDIQMLEQADDELDELGLSKQAIEGYKAGWAAAERVDLDLLTRHAGSIELPVASDSLDPGLELYQLRARAELELAEAKREAEYTKRAAQLQAEKIELDARRENLDREPYRRERGLRGWILAIVPAPIIALPLLTLLGAVVAIFQQASIIVTILLAAPVAFTVLTYALITSWSALKVMRSDLSSPEETSGADRTLRLLLGSLSNEVAMERARSVTIAAAVRSTESNQHLSIHIPHGSRGLEGISIRRSPETPKPPKRPKRKIAVPK